MERNKTFNFAAGPSTMPLAVLEKAQREMLNYHGCGMSVMEITHRGPIFGEILHSAKSRLCRLMNIPDTHEILFLQGGASTQFSAIPMNLIEDGTADYAITGNFSNKAAQEAEKYGRVNVVCSSAATNYDRIPSQSEIIETAGAKYFYYCANNTVYGTEWQYVPEVSSPLICDMSSDILSRQVDVSRYGLIFGGAQKNMSPAGLTFVIVDKRLLGRELPITPTMLNYKIMVEGDSLYNTPPCWCIYMLDLVLEWVEDQGGVKAMEELRDARAELLYGHLDNSKLFNVPALPGSRSYMNVVFNTGSAEIDAQFVRGAAERGLLNVNGHKLIGGLRASIYNAMTMEGVEALVDYMKEFETKLHV